MAGTALQRRLGWRAAPLIAARDETATARTLRFAVPGWSGHLAGQHVDIRLTAEDGYTAQRSYSLSAPDDGGFIEVTVQLVADGEVSPYLVRDLQEGDVVEVLGPLGGWFVWRPDQLEPVLLIGGGSGVAPLMAMLRARARSEATPPIRLLYSVRTPHDIYFADELVNHPDAVLLYTRQAPAGVERTPHRFDQADLKAHGLPPHQRPTCYVCGPTPFVEAVTALLTDTGHDPTRVRAERFGG
jgi:ferredoxin-NADP reductase